MSYSESVCSRKNDKERHSQDDEGQDEPSLEDVNVGGCFVVIVGSRKSLASESPKKYAGILVLHRDQSMNTNGLTKDIVAVFSFL
jgi:hypothetical protein